MNRAIVAECFLRLVTNRQSASTIAGDLIETYSRCQSRSFWSSLLQLFIAFIWKPALGLTAAMLVWFIVDSGLFIEFARAFRINHLQPITFSYGILLVKASANLSALAAFSLVAYGVKDRLWIVSGIYAALAGTLAFSLWANDMQRSSWALLGAAAIVGLSTQTLRRELGVILASLTAGFLPGLFFSLLLWVISPRGMSQRAFFAAFILTTLGTPAVLVVVCGWAKQRIQVRRVMAN